jgi:DNA-damage-inducible protein J
MAKSAIVSTRIDPALKDNAENIFKRLGLTVAQAITLFYKQVELQHGLPFHIKIPNEETKMALRDAQLKQNLVDFESADQLFEDLGI